MREHRSMKRAWLLFIAAFLAPSSASFAADLRKPAPPEMMAPTYNWTGFYIGANLGGAWSNVTLTDNLTGASVGADRSGVTGGGTATIGRLRPILSWVLKEPSTVPQ